MMEIPNRTDRPDERRRSWGVIAGVAAIVFFAFVLAAAARTLQHASVATAAVAPDAALSTGAPLAPPAGAGSPETLSRAFSAVAKAIGPAVVHINIVQERSAPTSLHGFGFGFPDQGNGGTFKERGSGSGVIVNANGYIITNNHVAGKASSIEVKLADGRKFKGTVVGADPQTDLAVVKIDATGLPTANLGNSDQLEQGDWVVAMGSPFGLEQTITAGIVSATGRRLAASPYDAFIQTDASINPGNSGGPLVSLNGEVIGINTLIFSESGGNQGIGFAIPSTMVRKVYDEIVSKGKVTRGYLGVTVRDLDPALAKAVGVPETTKGAVVSDTSGESSPAAKAGLKSGDVITSVNGTPVTSAQDLTSFVADLAPGATAEVKFLRDGREQSARVTLGERPASTGLPSEDGDDQEQTPGADSGASRQKLGAMFHDVTPEIAQELHLKMNSGAVITAVSPDGAASASGLQRGDVIHRIDRTQISSASDVDSALAGLKSGTEVAVQVERRGQLVFATVTLD